MAAFDRFDDHRLREAALLAFVKAVHTDRMVAVTGAMATQSLGYPGWDEFIVAYAIIARDVAKKIITDRDGAGVGYCSTKPILAGIVERATNLIASIAKKMVLAADGKDTSNVVVVDVRVALWTFHDAFRMVDREMREGREGLVLKNQYQSSAVATFEARVAEIFRSRTFPTGKTRPQAAAIHPLIASLGIKRIATLNYDLELERAFMIRGDESDLIRHDEEQANLDLARLFPNDPPSAPGPTVEDQKSRFAERKTPAMSSVAAFIGSPETGKPIVEHARHRLSRTMGNGVHVESDVVSRERPDRLFEFAVGSAEIDRHLLHLHGRADAPGTMVANIRQYDRLYRLDDLYRDPFDHGLRILVGGNPIVFVGLGMTEPEINATLEYFISNVPVRRPAPTFLIWSLAQSDERERVKALKRLDFMTRLGVHLLFDDDLPPLAPPLPGDLDKLARLANSLKQLPALVSRVDHRTERIPAVWRSIDRRLDTPTAGYRMWGSEELGKMVTTPPGKGAKSRFDLARLAAPGDPAKRTHYKLVFAAAANGYGRGELSEYLLRAPENDILIGHAVIKTTTPPNRLLVNAGFSYDSDAMLSGIARFLARRIEILPGRTAEGQEKRRNDMATQREKHFADGSLFATSNPTLVIINGVDRFFGFDGTPLSAEFDHMLRCAHHFDIAPDSGAENRVQFLLLGTSRIRKYCQALGLDLQILSDHAKIERNDTQASVQSTISLETAYLAWVRTNFQEKARPILDEAKAQPTDLAAQRRGRACEPTAAALAQLRRAATIDHEARSRTFFEAYLSPPLLRALGLDCPATFEVLRTLCFIGTPVEALVLLHAPKVHAILAERNQRETEDRNGATLGTNMLSQAEIRRKLVEVIEHLVSLGLLLKLDPHEPEADSSDVLRSRYGLHRTLATFLRDRHGAPINDAKLATTFNMSLFMSDPSDTTAPEPGFHDELGNLVDRLAGAWHDLARHDKSGGSGAVAGGAASVAAGETRHQLIVDPDQSGFGGSALEDALRVLYLHDDERPAAIKSIGPRALRETSACLRAAFSIVRSYFSTGVLLKLGTGDGAVSIDRDGALTEHAQRIDRLITSFGKIAAARDLARAALGDDTKEQLDLVMGPEPFYADDLVWLHNERAVVALAQGHLFEAREALSHASRINSQTVESDFRGHNWRRIAVNFVLTRIERGSLKSAERYLDQIEQSVEESPWPRPPGDLPRVDAIRARFDRDNLSPPIRGTEHFAREEMTIVALTTGYRGLIGHMRGRYDDARVHYTVAVRMLHQLGEGRAYAHFQRHLAELEGFFSDKKTGLIAIEFAITAAQSTRQMDIFHRARIVRANFTRDTSRSESHRRHALQDIKDALDYAARADCYRVRIEASASLARHMRLSGDYDTALRYAADAMTTAARYGHSLHKTSLRIELGRILIARGDPISGRALLDQAEAIGTAKGYNLALERIRRALAPSMPHRTDVPVMG